MFSHKKRLLDSPIVDDLEIVQLDSTEKRDEVENRLNREYKIIKEICNSINHPALDIAKKINREVLTTRGRNKFSSVGEMKKFVQVDLPKISGPGRILTEYLQKKIELVKPRTDKLKELYRENIICVKGFLLKQEISPKQRTDIINAFSVLLKRYMQHIEEIRVAHSTDIPYYDREKFISEIITLLTTYSSFKKSSTKLRIAVNYCFEHRNRKIIEKKEDEIGKMALC